jgi:hypothetical protein
MKACTLRSEAKLSFFLAGSGPAMTARVATVTLVARTTR